MSLYAGGAVGERVVRPSAVHGGGLHQWQTGHGGEHPAGDGLQQQRQVSSANHHSVLHLQPPQTPGAKLALLLNL